jgi:hypothetical protein
MAAATSPSAANPFITEADMAGHSSHAKTLMVSDGTNSFGGDYEGADALEDALVALNAADGGLIFVKRGAYTLNQDITMSKPVNIICEGTQFGSTTAEKCELTLVGGTRALDFIQAVTIERLIITHSSSVPVSFGAMVFLNRCHFNGKVVFDTSGAATGSNPEKVCSIRSCYFTPEVDFDNCRYGVTVTGCRFVATTATSSQAVRMLQSSKNIVFDNCTFDGHPTFPGTANKGAFAVISGADVSGGALRDCFFQVGTGSNAISFSVGATVDEYRVENCTVNMVDDAVTTTVVSIAVPDDSLFVVDGLRFTMGFVSTGEIRACMLELAASDRSVLKVSNVLIEGGDRLVEISSSILGLITMGSIGASNVGALLSLDTVAINNVRYSETDLNSGVIILANITGGISKRIAIRNVEMDAWGTTAAGGNSYLACIRITELDNECDVLIEGCRLDGSELDGGASTENWYGIYIDNPAIDRELSQVTINDCFVAGFTARDIETEGRTPRMRITNCTGRGATNAVAGIAGARWHLYSGSLVVANNTYNNNSVASGDTFIYVEDDGTGGTDENSSFVGNVMVMDAATDDAIYVDDLTALAVFVFAGNAGTGQINALNADGHVAIGDGDANVNAIAVNLR